MLGLSPGALLPDAYMLGIDPPTQRRYMDESLGIIIRLLTETQPITYEAETRRDAIEQACGGVGRYQREHLRTPSVLTL